MGKIKILYTIPNFKTAGSQYVLISLFERMDKSVFDPFVCIENYPTLVPETIPAERQLLFHWSGSKLRDIWRFRGLVKKNRIDIVHSWDYKSNYLEALATRLAGVKFLYTKKNNTWSRPWRLKSFFSTHIVYDNPEMRNRYFDSSLFRNKVSLISHGVDTSIFKPNVRVSGETFNIGCIGNINKNKNQLFIIRVLMELPEKIVLHLYGKEDKEYRERIDRFIKSNALGHRVYFHGFIKNSSLPAIYRKMDLFVLASRQEGLPVSIIEAMACGVPVLASDSGGGSKFILKDGGGYLFDVDDFKGLGELIFRLEQNPQERNRLAKEGRKNAVSNFSLEYEITAYELLYKRMME